MIRSSVAIVIITPATHTILEVWRKNATNEKETDHIRYQLRLDAINKNAETVVRMIVYKYLIIVRLIAAEILPTAIAAWESRLILIIILILIEKSGRCV